MGFCLLFMFLEKQRQIFTFMALHGHGLDWAEQCISLSCLESFLLHPSPPLPGDPLSLQCFHYLNSSRSLQNVFTSLSFEAISCLTLNTELLPSYFMSLFGCIPSFHQDESCTLYAHVEMKSKMPVFDNGIQLSPSHSKYVEVMSHSQNPQDPLKTQKFGCI